MFGRTLISIAALALGAGAATAQDFNAEPPNAADQQPAFEGQTRAPALTDDIALETTTVVDGLVRPWGLAELPGGEGWLVTERPGRLRHVGTDGHLSEPLSGVPDVDANGQGGLLDVAVSPDFANDRTIYLSFAEARGNGENATAVAKGVLNADATGLEDTAVIWQQQPAWDSDKHFGSRIAFDASGNLFVTVGERSNPEPRATAQNLDNTLGKLIHISPTGGNVGDGPSIPGAMPEIYAMGLRNVQASAVDSSGQLWTIEHGAQGGDELNRIEEGKNYGWPVITYGEDYSGGPIGEGITAQEGMEQPVYYWDPVIGPSGMIFYQGEMFPEWNGQIIAGGLVSQSLVRLQLEGDRVVGEARPLAGIGRVRDVAEASDGSIMLVTDAENGKLIRVSR